MMQYLSGISLAVVFVMAALLGGCSRDSETADNASTRPNGEQAETKLSAPIVKVSRPWVRANPAPGRPWVVFFEIENSAAEDDSLTGVTLPAGGRAELHTHKHDDGIMRMHRVDSVAVPAMGRVALQPGGHHVMLFDQPSALIGGQVALVLHFKEAGDIEILAEIQPISGTGPSGTGETP